MIVFHDEHNLGCLSFSHESQNIKYLIKYEIMALYTNTALCINSLYILPQHPYGMDFVNVFMWAVTDVLMVSQNVFWHLQFSFHEL